MADPDKVSMPQTICEEKHLPADLVQKAALDAIEINPMNAPSPLATAMLTDKGSRAPLRPDFLAVLTTKYWGAGGVKLSVGFLESAPKELQERILSHMNAWRAHANVSFELDPNPRDADVRITLSGGGYWSYLGTDIRSIPRRQPTMSLQGFSMQTPESEYLRVVRHETGHTLGFPHEHLRGEIIERLDPAKVIRWGRRVLGWDEATIRSNILTPLEESELIASPHADESSIMSYQLPGEVTRDGSPIHGGSDLTATDIATVAKLYPKLDRPEPPKPGGARLMLEAALEAGAYLLIPEPGGSPQQDARATLARIIDLPGGLLEGIDWAKFFRRLIEAILEALSGAK